MTFFRPFSSLYLLIDSKTAFSTTGKVLNSFVYCEKHAAGSKNNDTSRFFIFLIIFSTNIKKNNESNKFLSIYKKIL